MINVDDDGQCGNGPHMQFYSCFFYVTGKVKECTQKVELTPRLCCSINPTLHMQLSHNNGLTGRWTFLLQTIPNLLLPLETGITHLLIPALSGLPPCSTLERDLLALPVRHGRLGIVNPACNPVLTILQGT